MEISQHIKNLLVSNERVILNGFGAFTTKQVSAKYDEATNTMKPPFKIVTFDQTIKVDAGLLSNHIAMQEGFTKNASEELINEFVKTIQSKLKAGQTVEFKDLGTFNQSSNGNIDFAFLSDENLLLDAFGLPVVSISNKKEVSTSTPPKVKQKAKVQKKTITKEKPKVEKVRKLKVQKAKTPKEKKKRKKWPIFVILIAAIGLILTSIYFFKPNLWAKGYNFSTEKIVSVKQMFNKDKGQYDIIDPDKETKENNSEITKDTTNVVPEEEYTDEDDIITKDDNVTENENTDFEETTDNVVPEKDNNDNTIVEETTEEVVNTEESPAQKGKYYIIIGSVKSEVSAKKEQKRFSKKGITTSIIHIPNKNRYRISMGEFSSAKEAQKYYSDMQSKHGNIEAWVWEKR